MISFGVKQESAPSSLASKTSESSKKEPTLSFSELLKGAGEKKVVQNGALVLSLDSDVKTLKDVKTTPKSEALLALLKNSDKADLQDSLELNPKLGLSALDMKSLVGHAKEYLKTQILNSDGYKKSQLKELPHTLKGLSELAKKYGVDVSKITLEEVQAKKTGTLTADIPHVKEKKVKSSQTKETKVEVQSDKDISQFEKALKEDATKTKETSKVAPLLKAQNQTELTTEQLVQTKASGSVKVEEKNQKSSRADETLKQLLRGEKPLHATTLTAPIVLENQKVEASSNTENSFEKLLHNDKSDSSKNSKLDGLTVHKADSFEVKLNEAKQMIKYLSADVKSAIEDYKAPFTRIKVQLNPQKLGEVELTIIQRGKNLHVNLSSNSAAINTLAMNATELRTQLNNSGINNATLNFNSSSDNSGASQQQGQKQQEKRAHEEYSYQTKEEQNEEILSSLEIVVPRYI